MKPPAVSWVLPDGRRVVRECANDDDARQLAADLRGHLLDPGVLAETTITTHLEGECAPTSICSAESGDSPLPPAQMELELFNSVRSTPDAGPSSPAPGPESPSTMTFGPSAWPTPRAEDSEMTGAHRGVPDTLTSATRAAWPTPAHNEFIPADIPGMLDRREREKAKGRNGTGFGLTVGMLAAWNEAESGFSPLESPVSPPPAPESSEEQMMTAGSGRKLCACFDTSSPLGRFSRILLESETWASPEFLLRWRIKTTKCGSTVYQLAPSARRTGANGTGSWPTARGQDSYERRNMKTVNRIALTGGDLTLPTALRASWPTAQSRDGKGARTSQATMEKNSRPLNEVLMQGWPTPTRADQEEAGAAGTQYLTPTLKPGTISCGCLARTEKFVVRLATLSAWLMGYTARYLALWETASSRKSQKS